MTPTRQKFLVVALVVAAMNVAAVRIIWGHREPSLPMTYEAFAHVYVGGLLGAWLCGFAVAKEDRGIYHLCGVLALLLSVFELIAFFMTR